ncbi:FOXRED1 [Cordylochernes scorpioides]|uniref:FOXRED1 n=1 Tax=Cordylochernes scorpioides TaxID=51811 RepID=A0ABY6KZT6_9ARAC|nr:FOXRED1 [Cordylochernes scorpioides]
MFNLIVKIGRYIPSPDVVSTRCGSPRHPVPPSRLPLHGHREWSRSDDGELQPPDICTWIKPDKSRLIHQVSNKCTWLSLNVVMVVWFSRELGAKIHLMSQSQLKGKFPWINEEGIALATHGIRNEGWFDPWSLLAALRQNAAYNGVDYVNAEVVGFEFAQIPSVEITGFEDEMYRPTNALVIKHPDGVETKLDFHKLIVAAGAESGNIGKLLNMGNGPGVLNCPMPVEPR